jgi:AraC family transcriptional regulator
MEPKIVYRPAFIVAGVKYRGKNENDEIPHLWGESYQRLIKIPQRVRQNVVYGILHNYDEESSDFDYLAGIEITNGEELAEGLTCWEIPEQTYAVCSCTLPKLGEAFQNLQNEWLPQSDYERAPGPEFELYDEEYHAENPSSIMYIYVPIRPSE